MKAVASLAGPLIVLGLIIALALSYQPRPQRHPSVLEKSCRLPGNMISVPCRYLDEYLETQWDI